MTVVNTLKLGSTRLSYLHQPLFNFNKFTEEHPFQPTVHICEFSGARFLNICAISLDKQSRGHERSKPTQPVFQSSLLHSFYIHQCGFSRRIQWWSFHSKRTRNEHTGDFITFSELILFVYFQNTGIHHWTRISETAVQLLTRYVHIFHSIDGYVDPEERHSNSSMTLCGWIKPGIQEITHFTLSRKENGVSMVDIPFDIWLHITSFLSKSELWDKRTINHMVFHIALDNHYRPVSINLDFCEQRENIQSF